MENDDIKIPNRSILLINLIFVIGYVILMFALIELKCPPTSKQQKHTETAEQPINVLGVH